MEEAVEEVVEYLSYALCRGSSMRVCILLQSIATKPFVHGRSSPLRSTSHLYRNGRALFGRNVSRGGWLEVRRATAVSLMGCVRRCAGKRG